MQREGEEYNPGQDRKPIVAKQRNGPIGDVPVLIISSYTKFGFSLFWPLHQEEWVLQAAFLPGSSMGISEHLSIIKSSIF